LKPPAGPDATSPVSQHAAQLQFLLSPKASLHVCCCCCLP
jgi:hypothetical protein